jgi:hypothetical protein
LAACAAGVSAGLLAWGADASVGLLACVVGVSAGFVAWAAASAGFAGCGAGASAALLVVAGVALLLVASLPPAVGVALEAFAALGSRFSILVPPPVLLELDSPSVVLFFSILVPPPVLLELALAALVLLAAALPELALPLALAEEVASVAPFLP